MTALCLPNPIPESEPPFSTPNPHLPIPTPTLVPTLGHDTTILPLLAAWGVWDGHWPTYASLLSIELYETSEDHLFRMVYAGRELVLPGCDSGRGRLRLLQGKKPVGDGLSWRWRLLACVAGHYAS